jgi:hypothetical protein
MTSQSADLFSVAVRLDESPVELLNGGAAEALKALDAASPEAVASERGIDTSEVEALWARAGARLREVPGQDELFPAAAEAATLLYAAAWLLDSDEATTDGLRALM